MELIEKVANYLTTNGISYRMQGNIMKPDPNNAICIRDTGGYKPEIESSTRYPTIQIIARATTYTDAKQVSMAVYDLLHDKEFLSLDSTTTVMSSTATQEPSFMNEDQSGRSLVVCNYNMTIREVI